MAQVDGRAAERTLIFLHIPKTAGTTLSGVLFREYGPSSTSWVLRERLEDFKKLPEERKARMRALGGHMPFGLHEFLPGPVTYATILRHPVDRAISHYDHVVRDRQHYLHEGVASRNMSLEDYVSSGISLEMDNGQTRDLCGAGIELKPYADTGVGFGRCSTEMLELAKKNLQEYFSIVGLSERFDETLILLRRALGWRKTPYYVKSNVGRKRPSDPAAQVSNEARRTIERYNQLDLALYEYAARMFEARIGQEGPSFAREVRAFHLLNGTYGRLRFLSRRFVGNIKKRVSRPSQRTSRQFRQRAR
jgi:hypothetical protein